MAKIENSNVSNLARSIYRSGYPMLEKPPTPEEFNATVLQIQADLNRGELDNPHIKRAIRLAQQQGGGHDQFLTGITVDFDMTISNKAWVEAERYTFLSFISSMSTMHRISKMDIDEHCNEFVQGDPIGVLEYLRKRYHAEENPERKAHLYLEILYNLPSGFEIMAGMTTNYRCIKNIYHQRRRHRLPDWHVFCDWVETLPLAPQIILGCH